MHGGLLAAPYFLTLISCREIARGFPCVDPSAAKRLLQMAQLHVVLGNPEQVVSS